MEIRHDERNGRFVATLPGGEARLEYEAGDDHTLDYYSTFVPEEERERGVGERLVMHALDYARENDFRVIPSCPFVRRIVEQHSEYDDVVKPR